MKAKTLAVKPNIVIDGQVKQIDPDLLFQQVSVCNAMKAEPERRAAFDYEMWKMSMAWQRPYGLMDSLKAPPQRMKPIWSEQVQKHQPTLLSLRTGQFPVTKKTFFANKINHQNFIVALIKFLTQHGIKCNHASGDADLALVLDAIETAASFDTIVQGEDTDLLVLLLNLTTSDLKPITLKPHQRRASKKKAKTWPIQEAQNK